MFIAAIDGLPGSGKTTVIKLLSQRFRLLGMSFKRNSIGNAPSAKLMTPKAKNCEFGHPKRTFIFFNLRMDQLAAAEIESRSCDIVVMDRSIGSLFAGDIDGDQIPPGRLEWGKRAIEAKVDLILFFDVPFSVAQAHSRKKSKTIRDANLAQELEQSYRRVAREQNWVRIDATQSPKKIADDCFQIIIDEFRRKQIIRIIRLFGLIINKKEGRI